MADIMEMAKDLGNALARTDEYQALRRAISAADDDRDIVELTSGLQDLERRLQQSVARGEQPGKELQEEYEETMGKLQSMASYQRLVAAQVNFDKIVQKVNQTIQKGLEEGADSRIILPS